MFLKNTFFYCLQNVSKAPCGVSLVAGGDAGSQTNPVYGTGEGVVSCRETIRETPEKNQKTWKTFSVMFKQAVLQDLAKTDFKMGRKFAFEPNCYRETNEETSLSYLAVDMIYSTSLDLVPATNQRQQYNYISIQD